VVDSDLLTVAIPPPACFYSLYADGQYSAKHYYQDSGVTELVYGANAALFVYYTYPTHRRVYLIRNVSEQNNTGIHRLTSLPGLSKKVRVLFKQIASRVDKTKHAVSYLNTHYEGAYRFPDIFYYRLNALLLRKGKLPYRDIAAIAKPHDLTL
jgi:hypothetical protein